MLKKVSAALGAASLFAAPAIAAPKTSLALTTKSVEAKGKILHARDVNAKASVKKVRHGHHRSHKHAAMFKKHPIAKVVKTNAAEAKTHPRLSPLD